MTGNITPITMPPSKEEIYGRLAKVRKRMESERLDYYVAAHTDNLFYLTNFAYIPFERPFFLVIPIDDKPVLILPELEAAHAENRVMLEVEYRTYYEYPAQEDRSFLNVLRNFISDGRRVGVESSLSVAHYRVMPGRLQVADIIDEVRLVKSDYEVGRIAYASAVVKEGLKKVFELSKPGTQELVIYSEGVRQMMGKIIMEIPNLNMLVTKCLCIVWPKTLSAQPHSVPGLFDILEKGGPNVSIVTAQADGYSAELERTYFFGEIPEEAKAPFKAVMEARALAYKLVKPGVRAAEVDKAVLKAIRDQGYGDNILHRTGHGFGITGHEPPWVAIGSEEVLEKNMVISIEPGIYIQGIGGFRHSDTVLVTDKGCVSLTQWPDIPNDLILPI